MWKTLLLQQKLGMIIPLGNQGFEVLYIASAFMNDIMRGHNIKKGV